ncbi:uncharacterized protein BX664DRAFT_337422 [Halteromyces radiatus]|uniref:uncharacterized protein n=1 Tax=Halteromyces radiatus TaxID=101107 RepID=UPI00221F9B4B|nr:uncharacterized protein BX664DRAFT_337422 [Halteromyces radiatus]KAI8084623.1 hypothetical protein BX664DRAFT_337422 [Halteromyces radiatus]
MQTTNTTQTTTSLYCNACQQPLEGELVRALDGTFHLGCFNCLDCHEPVASMFFPIETADGSQQPLCERDYFRRLNLVCDHCGDALKGSYITAVDKKFHLEHFCCCTCGEVFGPEDSYYEYNNNVYCHYHYSVKFAITCTGCQTAILKQFVELNRNNVDEHWHPECYMIHKFWNVKLAKPSNQLGNDLSHLTATELRDAQTAMEEKVYRIWTVLSAFEDSSAACISDMLVHVSEGSYGEGVRMADYFITHVDVLFCAIDELATHYSESMKEELLYDREARMLCKKVTNFFALLSHTQVGGLRRIGITQDLLSLVTGLAQYLKVLIRLGLTGALKLENANDVKSAAISRFLSQLVKLANGRQHNDLSEYSVSSDLCQTCRSVCDNQCYRFQSYRWHDHCFACSQCCALLGDDYQGSFIQLDDLTLYCNHCGNKDTMSQGFERITKLQQFSFLLRVALKRLYQLLDVQDVSKVSYDGSFNKQLSSSITKESGHPTINTKHLPSIPEPPEKNAIHLGDIKRTKSTHMNRNISSSQRIAKRSTLMETPSPTSAYITSQPDTNDHSGSLLIDIHAKNSNLQKDNSNDSALTTSPTTLQSSLNALDLNNKDALLAKPPTNLPQRPSQDYVKTMPKAKFYYFAELGSLDHYMLKHIAVLYLEELLKDYISLEELADLIDDKKNSTLWGKFVTSLKTGGNKKTHAKEGTFGVPLEVLVEKNGVDSNLGASPTRVRIPSIIEETIFAMKQMDVSVEGIFRKNGNIRHLKDMIENIDKNPNDINLMNENAIQLAALIKKFLREMPEPLLTFKLHRLFTTIQKLEKEADRKRAMHLTCCLLPKCNRDTMEVLFLFIRWVSTFAHTENDGGNKMDLLNLATMIAPNLLYSKSKDPIKDESFGVIEAVFLLLQHQEEFATVPEDFVPMLENLSYGEGDMDLNVRHILKKCEVVMKMARNQAGRSEHTPAPPLLPRQHSSPAAVPTSSSTSNSPPSTPNPSSTAAVVAHVTDPYPAVIDGHNSSSTLFDPPSSFPHSATYSMSSSPIDMVHPKQQSETSTSSSVSSSSTSPPLPPVTPQLLLRSQSSSQFDTNDSLRKPSLLV